MGSKVSPIIVNINMEILEKGPLEQWKTHLGSGKGL